MKRVLVVDNNEAELSKIERSLGSANFSVVATWSGREALRLLSSEDFDALVVDDYLPDMHVDDFLRTAGNLPATPFLLVMMNEPTLRDEKRFHNLNVTTVADKRLIASIPQTIALILERGCKTGTESEPSTNSMTSTNPDSSGGGEKP